MGKLRDIINARSKGENVQYKLNVEEMVKPSPVQIEESERTKDKPYYNRTWLSRVALQKGYAINPDDKKVDGILGALNRRNGYCPCGGTGEQFKCPCANMRNLGICKCGIYLSIPDRKIGGGTSSGRIE